MYPVGTAPLSTHNGTPGTRLCVPGIQLCTPSRPRGPPPTRARVLFAILDQRGYPPACGCSGVVVPGGPTLSSVASTPMDATDRGLRAPGCSFDALHDPP